MDGGALYGSANLTNVDGSNLCVAPALEWPQTVSAGIDAGASVSLQFGVRRLRKNPISRSYPEKGIDSGRVFPCGGGMRDADGFDSRRRTADASADRRDRSWPGRTQEIYLSVHECIAAEGEVAFIQAKQISFLFCAHGRTAGAPRFLRVPGGRLRRRSRGHS